MFLVLVFWIFVCVMLSRSSNGVWLLSTAQTSLAACAMTYHSICLCYLARSRLTMLLDRIPRRPHKRGAVRLSSGLSHPLANSHPFTYTLQLEIFTQRLPSINLHRAQRRFQPSTNQARHNLSSPHQLPQEDHPQGKAKARTMPLVSANPTLAIRNSVFLPSTSCSPSRFSR